MRGHVRERGKGNWYAVLSIHDPVTGKRKVKWHKLSVTGKRKAEAECARLITELRNGGYCESDRVTVGQFLDRWLEYIRAQVSPRTHERYAEIARKNLIPTLGAIQLTKLQPTQIGTAYAKVAYQWPPRWHRRAIPAHRPPHAPHSEASVRTGDCLARSGPQPGQLG